MQSARTIWRTRSLPKVGFHPGAVALAIVAFGAWGCGGGSTSSPISTSPPPPLPSVSVTVTPKTATLSQGGTQSFTATVTGTTNTAVTWSAQEGSIDSAGLYTAPKGLTGTFRVVAMSQANPTSTGMAAVTIRVPQLTISPLAATLSPQGTQTFTAGVAGFANTSVTWAVQEAGGGQINGAGFYSAPGAQGLYHVIATSTEPKTLTASATVTVTTSSSRFAPTGSLNVARGLHTATLLPNGKVLVAYGSNSSSYAPAAGYVGLSSIELYDPSTGTFTEILGEDGTGIYGHTATLLANGNVLLTTSFVNSVWDYAGISTSSNGANLYDSTTGEFSGAGGHMTASRGYHTATLLANGKVLIAGGADQDPTGTGLASAELYDPSTRTFTPTGSMAVGRFLHTATQLQDGKVLIVGGALTSASRPISTAEVYDPATGVFIMTGAMATARKQHTATLLADGRVLIVGGTTSGGATPTFTATAEVYDPSTGLFSATGSMGEARTLHSATLLPNGKVLVAGGGDENSTAEIFDPATGTFSITGGMEIGRSGHTATLLPNGSVLVVGGGIFAGLATAELYQNGTLSQDPWGY